MRAFVVWLGMFGVLSVAGAQPFPASAPVGSPGAGPQSAPSSAPAEDLPCQGDCLAQRACGDGTLQRNEACDQGSNNSNERPDACRLNCQLPFCGDGVQDSGEACDLGSGNGHGGCSFTCQSAICGDGYLQEAEGCDDGNALDGDGCSSVCLKEQAPPPPADYLRSPGVAVALSSVPTLFGYGAATAGLILRANDNPKATTWLVLGLSSAVIGPAFGRMYIREYDKAGLYTVARLACLGAAALGASIEDEEDEVEIDSQLLVGGVIGFVLLTVGDSILVGSDARKKVPPGGVQPLFTAPKP